MTKPIISISPIAIDLGAKNTGVYFAHYPAGSSPDKIDREGKVYQLEKTSYTLLMVQRTAARHQRRGYDRRQMTKRLLKLIWRKHFGLEWDKDVQQTLGFLLNRRGFSFLTEEYDADILSQFPKEAFNELPNELQIQPNDNGNYDFASALIEWVNQDAGKIKPMYEALSQEPKKVRRRLFLISKTEKLCEYCSSRKEGNDIPKEKKANLSRLSKWILEYWVQEGIQGLPAIPTESTVDIVKYLNEQEPTIAEKILHSMQDLRFLKQQKDTLKRSHWNFEPEKFNMDNADFGEADNPNVNVHLHHFAFALHKLHYELSSGGRHRSKYFEEVKTVLKNETHTHGYLKRFCGKLQSSGFQRMTVDSLSNLIGHISNLELKPLRKYFHDKRHQKGDFWDEARLSERFENWMLREWRINPQKDELKAEGGDYDYKVLREKWQEKSGTVIDFWLNTDPNYTVPPYQDNSNRRPPKCQSLLLNVGFLERKYPDWQQWLSELKGLPSVKDYLGNYAKELAELKSGKNKKYFTKEKTGKLLTDTGRRSRAELDARILQFIFDRTKAEDPIGLNEIYSHAKKIKQDKRDRKSTKDTEEKLKTALSRMPKELAELKDETVDGIFPEKSFLHLICKYYKLRQRARDGRIYIHPEYRYVPGRSYENTGRFDDKEHLLTYCNHKPRQKRYQMLGDLAGLLQVSPRDLEKIAEKHNGKTTDDKLFDWLSRVNSLKTNCERAASEQKDRRGRLKLDIQSVFGLIYYRKQSESPSNKETKEILKHSKVENAQKLYSFCQRSIEFCLILTKSLYNAQKQEKWESELDKNPATAVYFLAQINNIAFKERSGNANTCAVCSMDNAYRMQIVPTNDGKDATAKAQRVPAIPTRIIDGAVMRMARIVGGEIAEDKWAKIKTDIATGKKVYIPIITESNQFEFEPSKEELVKGQRSGTRKGKVAERGGESKIYAAKDERIKMAGKGICPYTGKSVSGGDKDHIIPRSSGWGTLNDEANLIWASDKGNKEIKKENIFALADLSDEYKDALFRTKDDSQIKKWIIKQIGDGSGEDFEFGKYRSFINLSPDQQTAFRHALFLVGDDLREKVISAIDNKNRTFVNGTQRYFAEVLANQLHKLAKREGKEKLLFFDYFGVEAKPNSAGNSIYDLRKMYEATDDKIAGYAKSKDKKQQAYSHLIDAQLAFVIIADAHRKEGGLKLQIDEGVRKEPYDKETGEIYDGLLKLIQVPDDDFEVVPLSRRKTYDVETHHRELLHKGQKNAVQISYKIHRDNLIAEKFMPLIQLKNGEFKKGFSIENSVNYKNSDFEKIKEFLRPCANNKNILLVKKREALNYLMNAGRNGLSKEEQKTARLLDGLIYQTIKKQISAALTAKQNEKDKEKSQCKKSPETVADAMERWDKFIQQEHFKKDGVVLPIFREWGKLKSELEKADPDQSLQVFLQNSEMFRDKQNATIRNHNRKRKTYSLPMIAGIGSIRLKRRSWNGQSIIQTAADESLSKYGLDSKQRPHTVLSKNSIPVKHYFGIPQKLRPEPRGWKEIPDSYIIKYNDNESIGILSGKIKHQDAGRCRVNLKVKAIKQLSLPQDKENWKGKLFRYEETEDLQEKIANEKGDNHHYLSSEWRWFSKPFELPKDRNDVIVRDIDGAYEIEFTIRKAAEIERLLLL